MDRSYLDVNAPYVDEALIQEMILHSFQPFSSTSLKNGNEVQKSIQNRRSHAAQWTFHIYRMQVDKTRGKVIQSDVQSKRIGQFV